MATEPPDGTDVILTHDIRIEVARCTWGSFFFGLRDNGLFLLRGHNLSTTDSNLVTASRKG